MLALLVLHVLVRACTSKRDTETSRQVSPPPAVVVGPWMSFVQVLHDRVGWETQCCDGTHYCSCCSLHSGYRSNGEQPTVTAPSEQQQAAIRGAGASIVAVPKSIRDVDNGKILGFGADLAEDHPVGHGVVCASSSVEGGRFIWEHAWCGSSSAAAKRRLCGQG